MGPVLDVFVTLLSLGRAGWSKLLADREGNMEYLRDGLSAVAASLSEAMLTTSGNPISMAMSLDTTCAAAGRGQAHLTLLGSMLFSRCVSGCRIVVPAAARCEEEPPPVRLRGEMGGGGGGMSNFERRFFGCRRGAASSAASLAAGDEDDT